MVLVSVLVNYNNADLTPMEMGKQLVNNRVNNKNFF